MEFVLLMFVIICILGLSVFIGEPEHMVTKRTFLFEDENGEKVNPFSSKDEDDEGDSQWQFSENQFE